MYFQFHCAGCDYSITTQSEEREPPDDWGLVRMGEWVREVCPTCRARLERPAPFFGYHSKPTETAGEVLRIRARVLNAIDHIEAEIERQSFDSPLGYPRAVLQVVDARLTKLAEQLRGKGEVPPPAAPKESIGEPSEPVTLDEIEEQAQHGIPFYAYGDNQAACEMATRLETITEIIRRTRSGRGEDDAR